MDSRSKARPLHSLSLQSRPLSPLALTWSCDAELAAATADGIFIFLPDFSGTRNDAEAAEMDACPSQFSLSIKTSGFFRPNPAINGHLCSSAGVSVPTLRFPEKPSSIQLSGGTISALPSALGQSIRIEWSPNGLGLNRRPVLTALTTHGQLLTLGEHVGVSSMNLSSAKTRNSKNWKILWGLGAGIPVPVRGSGNKTDLQIMEDRAISFSWAQELGPGKAILAYLSHQGEVVLMAVQYHERSGQDQAQEGGWSLQEVARFDGTGPHQKYDDSDFDFIPHASASSLKWSSWLAGEPGYQTATLAYIASSHVAFRRVTISSTDWRPEENPPIRIESRDTGGICLPLFPEAFLEWEDAVWKDGEVSVGRGLIATPFEIKSFQIPLTGLLEPSMPRHSIRQCATVHASKEEMSTNPITGLIIHRPDQNKKPPVPRYTLVRLSATAANRDWFETTLLEEEASLPQWAEEIEQRLARRVSRAIALKGADSDSESEGDENVSVKGDVLVAEDASSDDVTMEDVEEAPLDVVPYRFRFWGLAASPGDGCTAVLFSQHGTLHPDRKGMGRIFFGWHVAEDGEASRCKSVQPRSPTSARTTEGRVWEWMYGYGDEVPGYTNMSDNNAVSPRQNLRLHKQLENLVSTMECVFCNAFVSIAGLEAMCANGHTFATCVASGIPIMAPGISRVCGVCGRRCLKPSELNKITKGRLSPEFMFDYSTEICGGCGGKFVV